MELVFVSELCGIACLSMQFVVVLDLLSSVVLPAATLLIFFFFMDLIFTHSAQYQTLVILLAAVGTPALLVIFTAKRMTYIGWMIGKCFILSPWSIVYIFSL
jgi:chitin synthase